MEKQQLSDQPMCVPGGLFPALARQNLSAVEYKLYLSIVGMSYGQGYESIACTHYHLQFLTNIQTTKNIANHMNKLIERNMLTRQDGIGTHKWTGKATRPSKVNYDPPYFTYTPNLNHKAWLFGLKLI